MRYSTLVEVYEQLSSTTKRLEKTDIISKFFLQLDEKDKDVLYLLLGNVFPEHDERKIGVSTQLVIKAISKATGVNENEIVKEWKQIGDLGEVSEKLIKHKKQSTLHSHVLTTEKVIYNLRKLPELEGAGTVDKKMYLLTELLTSATPKEALYITRTILSDLRIGIKESTLKEAMNNAFFNGDKESAKKIEDVINKRNDISEVFELVKKGNLKHLEKVSLDVGKPIKVMLAQKAKTISEGFEKVGKPAACFPKGELIFSNPSIKEIENFEENDLVIGKNGKFQKIEKRFKKRYFGNVIKIYPHYLFPFTLTKDHRVLIIKKQLCSWKNRLIICRPNCQEQKYGCQKNYKNYEIEWVCANELEKGDFILFPKFKEFQPKKKIDLKEFNQDRQKETKNNKIRSYSNLKGVFKGKWINQFIKLSPNFFELCGWYLAEGSSSNKGDIRFSLGYNEEKEAERIKKLIKRIFDIEVNILPNKNKGVRIIRIYSILLSNFFIKNFGSSSTNKKIPAFIMFSEKEKIKYFIKSYIQGDGHKTSKNIYTIVTASENIAYQIILLLTKLNILPSVGKYENKGLGKIQYRISIFGKQINNIEKNSHKTKTNHQRFFEDEDFFYIPIKKIEKLKYKGIVFNFETPDNTYLSSAIVHNCEYKYDGFRLEIHKNKNEIKLFTRRLENVTKQFPEVVEYINKYVKGNLFILDTEAVGYDPKTKEYLPFQNISQRIKRKYDIERLEKELPIEINVFDILSYNGDSLLHEPFEKRTELIKKIIHAQKFKIIPAKQIITSDEKKAEEFFKKALKDNQEGVMMKNLKAEYKPGSRVGYMLKIKPESRDLDLVITGAEYGTGKRSGWLSSFILSCKDKNEFLEIGKVGTGIKEKEEEGVSFLELTKLVKPYITEENGKNVKIKPKIVVSINYQEIQKSPTYSSGFALRFPRFTSLRPDRSPENIATLSEIKKDYESQKQKSK